MMSEKENARIITALRAHPHASAVAKKLGKSIASVCKVAKEAGIELTAGRAAQGRRLSAKKRAEIIKALRENPHGTNIAKKFNDVSLGTVYRIAKIVGIELTAGRAAQGKRISDEKRAQIVAVAETIQDTKKTAIIIGGVSHSTAYRIAKAANVKLRRGNTPFSQERRSYIADFYDAVRNSRRVAKETGVSRQTVINFARKAGIEPKNHVLKVA